MGVLTGFSDFHGGSLGFGNGCSRESQIVLMYNFENGVYVRISFLPGLQRCSTTVVFCEG